ncbi:MAG: hypothetical protein IH608_09270, partial [Proteobacteria bacterium]|nr:hypothetical protein [Pseudomonadota bacterium]
MGAAGLFLEPSGGSRLQPGQTLELASPVQEGGTSRFRATLYLLVPVDAPCQGITVASGSALALRFEPLTVNIGEHDGAWVTKWEAERDRVTVGLSRPAPITRVRSQIYGRARLYRVDGDAVASQPTATVATGAPLAEPFVANAFLVALDREKREDVGKAVSAYVEEQHESPVRVAKGKAVGAGTNDAHATGDAQWEKVRHEAVVRSALAGLD